MADALRGGVDDPRFWFGGPASQPASAFGAAVRVAGLLPEDRFDRQPLVSEDKATVFVCQARLDNRDELLGKLRLDADKEELADSDLLQAAFLRWGEGCLEHITGDYAFAAYSVHDRRLFAAVDHLGHYRLYYAMGAGAAAGEQLVMATQLAAVRACPGVSLHLDESALGVLGSGRMPFGEGETGFVRIRALPGGHSLLWHNGTVELKRWWTPDTGVRTELRNSDEYVEIARELFERAVRSCMRSSTTVSTTLSGGLDSGLVTATAARLLAANGAPLVVNGAQLTAYTAGPNPRNAVLRRERWDPDDTPFAAATAAMYPNLRHVVLQTEERVVLHLLPELFQRSATPVRNGANHVWLDEIARRAHACGSRVMLSGEHGNFALSYSGLGGFGELFRRLQWRAAARVAREMADTGERSVGKTVVGGLLPPGLFDTLWNAVYGRRTAEKGARYFLTESFQSKHRRQLSPSRPPERTRASFVRRATAPSLLWGADALPQWDIEMRDPTGDRRLLEALLQMPLHAFSAGGRARGLARQLGRGLLPDAVRLRWTQGQQAPDYAAVMGRQAGRYREAVRAMSGSAACVRLFDIEGLQQGIDAVEGGSTAAYLSSGIDRVVGAGLFLLAGETN